MTIGIDFYTKAMVYIFLMFWYRSEVLWNVPTLDLDPMSSIIAFPAGKPGMGVSEKSGS